MKLHTTNYMNTFIEVAEDCPVTKGEIPPEHGDRKTIARMQYDILKNNPYKYTSDDVLFNIYANRNNIAEPEIEKERDNFFSKRQPCFRSSPLTKRYGWGIHSNSEGRVALYGVESREYKNFTRNKDLKIVTAMRSKRKSG